MSDSAGDWCLIESDPGVFTQLIRKFGASGVQVEEIWCMDNSMFENLRPIHGLIFLFKYIKNEPITGTLVTDPKLLEKIYFSNQVINNACATQAIISLLLNCEHPDLELGPELTKLKEFSRSFDPKMRGLALSNSETIRLAHNSMCQQQMIEVVEQPQASDEDAFHYASYIEIEGRVYELDGLKPGPIDHGPVGCFKDWLDVARPLINARIQKYTMGEIHFNLLALVSDRKMVYERQLNEFMATSQLLNLQTSEIEDEVSRFRLLIDFEDIKMGRYASENARRRHNYLPFIINLLLILAKQKKLSSLLKLKDRVQRRGTKRLKT